jgi:diaminopimelate decarboxylase
VVSKTDTFVLPGEIRAGDYIEIGQMGAYNASLRCDVAVFFRPRP